MSMQIQPRLCLVVTAVAATLLAGCAGVPVSSHAYNNSYKVNQPVKAEGCYEASVLLAKSAEATAEIAAKVIAGVDATVSEKTPMQIKAARNRHIGLLVGSGGEELLVTFKPAAQG